LLGLILLLVTTAQSKPTALPVVAVSSQNMTQVVEIKRLPQTDSVDVFAWSPDSRVLAMGHQGVIDYWDVSEGRKTGSLSVGSGVKSIAFSPNGTMLAVSRGLVKLYDVASGSEIQTFDGNVLKIAFSPDGTRLAGGMYGGKAILWDTSSGKELRVFSDPDRAEQDQDTHPAFSPDGKILALGYAPRVTIWDVETGLLLSSLPVKTYEVFEFLSDGKSLATDYGLWDIGGRQVEWDLSGACKSISPDGSVSAFYNSPLPDFSTDRPRLTIVSLRVKQPERKLGPSHWSCPVAFSPDGRLLASGSNPVSLWGVPP
jgi:WD40 repeat protein